MKKPVNDIVNKEWAKSVKALLTGYSPDTTTLFTRLLTITMTEKQKLKSEAARQRFDSACRIIEEGIKYGWAFGINQEQVNFRRPAKTKGLKRVNALLPLAVTAGETIGKEQAARISKAHGIPKAGTFPMRHTHANPPVANIAV